MAVKLNEIKNVISADNRTGAAFAAAGRDASRYGKTAARAADIARVGFRGLSIAVTAVATASVAAAAASFRITQRMAATEDAAGKYATRMGVAVEELTRYHHVAGLSGVSNASLEKSFQRLPKSISDAGQGLQTSVRALSQLNLTHEQLRNLDPAGQFEAIAMAMQNLKDPSDKVRIAQDLMGRSGVEMLQIINQGTEAIREMKEESDLLGLTITGESAASAAAFNDEMLRLTSTTKGIVRLFTEQLKPIFTVVFREIRRAMLGNRDAAQEFAASIQDKVVGGLRIALEVMRFFHNGWLGIKLVGSAALTLIAADLEILLKGLRILLLPLDAIFEGLVRLGRIDVNPFDSLQNGLADFTAASADQTANVARDIVKTNEAYDSVGRTIDSLTEKINAQRAANQAAGANLSAPGAVPTEDPEVQNERARQAELLRIRHEADLQSMAFDAEMDKHLDNLHTAQTIRQQREIALEKAKRDSTITSIKTAIGGLQEAAQASNASFETQKKIAVAGALVATYKATVDAWESSSNPYLGFALAAWTFGVNMAKVNAMRRQSPGASGGGSFGGGSAPSFSVSQPGQTPSPSLDQLGRQNTEPTKEVHVHVYGAVVDGRQLTEIVDEAVGNGATVKYIRTQEDAA